MLPNISSNTRYNFQSLYILYTQINFLELIAIQHYITILIICCNNYVVCLKIRMLRVTHNDVRYIFRHFKITNVFLEVVYLVCFLQRIPIRHFAE
jgi:hypothetical protein